MFGLFKYTEKKCAQEIIKAINKHDPESKPVYEPARHRIVSDDAKVINLANIYNKAQTLTKSERREYIDELIERVTSNAKFTYDNSAHLLVPRLKTKAEIELRHLHALEGSSQGFRQLSYDFTDNYIMELGIDGENSITVVNEDTLESLKLSKEEAFAIALKNLYSISESPFKEVSKGLYISKYSDDHDAIRILLEDEVRKLEVQGKPLAIPASGATLIITGTEEFELHKSLIDLVKECTASQRPLSCSPLVLEDSGWVDFSLPEGEEYIGLRNLHINEMIEQYSGQKDILEYLYEKKNKDIFVASYMAFENNESLEMSSTSVWSEGVHSHIPVAETVTFIKYIDDDAQPMGSVSFKLAVEKLGDLMKPLGMTPERYEVIEFPDESRIQELVT
jgi:uncharacterized protein YtpQ (UPF0354 family)